MAVTARDRIPLNWRDWRERPDVTLSVQEARIGAQVVAESPANGIALLETNVPVANVTRISLDGSPDVRELIDFYERARRIVPGARTVEHPVVYDTAVEGLFKRGLGDLVTPALVERLRSLGLHLDQQLRHKYRRIAWIRMLEVAAAELFPGRPHEESYRLLGEHAVRGIGNTRIGQAITAIARVLGPRRALLRLKEAFPSLNNFMEVILQELKPDHFRMSLNETYGHPEYVQGAVCETMRIAGAKAPVVVIPGATAHYATLDVCWT
jgi:uncharacterized protein (TIGR02265 family)